ncbi:MAG TPA: methylmalonyl-CoA mutase family protein [Smithellaceae bacterium]|nr:methylmalonyl-CoA mutase family protein [Smithellaceae bacterium]HOM70560.1 methylmalonyl-CoA mutase family protein [Smithellaceae bacterium]HOS09033.1 methylmalonyl-CoA mutase family protein [Smithellaceae bacterium]HPD49393.1 methylmalonyl-CoA mutase family protein [Smithellaceae bacterium]HPL49739.1 methylmalonyl-CoA mutase family protein [Smithellaceae bacterium]
MFDKDALGKIKTAKGKWEKEILDRALGKEKERKDVFTSISGEPIERLYTPLDVSDLDYNEQLGYPGQFPFTRGVQPTMYRGRFWTMRQYAGFGSARESNARYRYLLEQGQTGLSIAFDLPTQAGYDSDHPLSMGEVGKVGVAVDYIGDMRLLFDEIPLDKVTTSMTINAPATVLLAMYLAVADEQGIPYEKLGGTVQNDILKEITVRGQYIYSPRPSMKLTVDLIEYCFKNVPRWNSISISGYHIREAGSTAAQEAAFTIADGIAYVQACVERGLDVDKFAPRLSFFFNAFTNVVEEVAKFRAARRVWAKIMKERFGAKDPRSLMLRFHVQTGGVTLTAQQPLNNIIRVTLQAYAAALGGCQSLHTNSYDEALCLPTEQAVTVALRTQQIVAEESGATDSIDPLAGSYMVEALTDKIEKQVNDYLEKIDNMGGTLKAIEKNYIQKEIQQSSYRFQKEIESNERVYVGINKYTMEEAPPANLLKVDMKGGQVEAEKLRKMRAARDAKRWGKALENLRKVSENNENVMPAVIEAVKAEATIGEICDVWREIYGEYKPKQSF